MKLQDGLSAYLDMLRFVAALSVLLGHMTQDGINISWLPLSHFSHEAVIIFFVLSGFIIHQSTTSRSTTAKNYAIARISRIYSVALPAIVASSIAALTINQLAPEIITKLTNYRPVSIFDTVSSFLFLNESWTNPANLTLNSPYWSLCYEVWFYIIFGLFLFGNKKARWGLIILAALIAGPGVMILMPVWLIGAWMSARLDWSKQWATPIAWLGFIIPIALIALINQTGTDILVRQWIKEHVPGFWRLGSSQRVLTDYIIGALLACHIRAFASLPQWVDSFFRRHKTKLAYMAGFSFTLYLFHRPMTQFIGAYAPSGSGQYAYPLAIGGFILLMCWLISFATERRLAAWRRWIASQFSTRNREDSRLEKN